MIFTLLITWRSVSSIWSTVKNLTNPSSYIGFNRRLSKRSSMSTIIWIGPNIVATTTESSEVFFFCTIFVWTKPKIVLFQRLISQLNFIIRNCCVQTMIMYRNKNCSDCQSSPKYSGDENILLRGGQEHFDSKIPTKNIIKM